jgi:Fe-Mn family superoxide dismutase
MSPQGGGEPVGELATAINDAFGSFAEMRDRFTSAALGRFGSGWAWLVLNEDGNMGIMSTSNQDTPYMVGLVPLLGIDVWEHAYYLKYQNLRGDYVQAWWNTVNWPEVARRLEAARG